MVTTRQGRAPTTRPRRRLLVFYTDRAIVGSARAVATMMRRDGATHRVRMGAGYLYARRRGATWETCAVIPREPGVWAADAWVATRLPSTVPPDRAIALAGGAR